MDYLIAIQPRITFHLRESYLNPSARQSVVSCYGLECACYTALILLESKPIPDALVIVERLVEIQPRNVLWLMALADIFQAHYGFQEIDVLEKLVSILPDDLQLLERLAYAYRKVIGLRYGRVLNQLTVLKRLISRQFARSELLRDLAHVYYRTGQIGECMAMKDRLLTAEKGSLEPLWKFISDCKELFRQADELITSFSFIQSLNLPMFPIEIWGKILFFLDSQEMSKFCFISRAWVNLTVSVARSQLSGSVAKLQSLIGKKDDSYFHSLPVPHISATTHLAMRSLSKNVAGWIDVLERCKHVWKLGFKDSITLLSLYAAVYIRSPPKDTPIGSLISNIYAPSMNVCQSVGFGDEDITITDLRTDDVINSYEDSQLYIKLRDIFATYIGEKAMDIKCFQVKRYLLKDSKLQFERICMHECTRRWLMKIISGGLDAFMIVGMETVMHAGLEHIYAIYYSKVGFDWLRRHRMEKSALEHYLKVTTRWIIRRRDWIKEDEGMDDDVIGAKLKDLCGEGLERIQIEEEHSDCVWTTHIFLKHGSSNLPLFGWQMWNR
jgi:hypothetical protein